MVARKSRECFVATLNIEREKGEPQHSQWITLSVNWWLTRQKSSCRNKGPAALTKPPESFWPSRPSNQSLRVFRRLEVWIKYESFIWGSLTTGHGANASNESFLFLILFGTRVWLCLDSSSDSFCALFAFFLGLTWDFSCIMFGLFLDSFWIRAGIHFGILLEFIWDYIGTLFGIFLDYLSEGVVCWLLAAIWLTFCSKWVFFLRFKPGLLGIQLLAVVLQWLTRKTIFSLVQFALCFASFHRFPEVSYSTVRFACNDMQVTKL